MKKISKKILHIVPAYPPSLGGMEQRVFELVHKLHAENVSVEVFTSNLNTQLAGPAIEDGMRVFRFKKLSFLQTPISFKLIVRLFTVRADIFHIHLAQPFFPIVSSVIALLRRKPYIVHIRAIVDSSNFFGKIFIYVFQNVALRFVFSFADTIIVLTQEYTELLTAKYHIPKNRITVIPNATDFSVISQAKELPINRAFQLIAVGRIDKQKNYHFMLRVLALLQKRGVNFTLSIVGTGRQESELKDYAANLGLVNRIQWRGRLEGAALEDVYAKSDVFIHTAFLEGFATVLIEAMTKGLPICAAKAIGVNDVVLHGRNGLLSEHNEEAFVNNLMELLQNSTLYHDISAYNLETVKNYKWENILRDTIEVYQSFES